MKIEVISETWVSSDNEEDDHQDTEKGESVISQEQALLTAQHERIAAVEKSEITTTASSASAAIQSLIQHYQQPIHQESTPSNLTTSQSPPPRVPFVEHWVETLSSSTKDGRSTNSKDESTHTSSRTHDPARVMQSLLEMYVSDIRPVVFPGMSGQQDPTVAKEGVPILQHYEILLARLEEEQTTLSISQENQETLTTLHAQSTEKNTRTLLPILQLLASDVTSQIQNCHHLVHQAEDHETNHHHTTEQELAEPIMTTQDRQDITQRQGQVYTQTRHIIIPLLVRLLHRTWALFFIVQKNETATQQSTQIKPDQGTPSREAFTEWTNVLAHCIMILLSFGRPLLGPQYMDETLQQLVAAVAQNVDTIKAFSDDTLPTYKAKLMDWKSLELPSSVWEDDNRDNDFLTNFWRGLLDVNLRAQNDETRSIINDTPQDPKSLSDWQRLFFTSIVRDDKAEKWMLPLARACRAHFFGRDMYATSIPSDDRPTWQVIPLPKTTKTRLHLGRTVTEEAKSYQKPHQEVPSRIHVACWFISHVTTAAQNNNGHADALSEQVLEELWPIVYDLLTAPRAVLVALGAVCVRRLLSVAGTRISPAVLENLKTMLESAVRSVRERAPLAIIGMVQSSLWEHSPGYFSNEHRLQALQQWLTILNRNQTLQMPLSWACLVGGVLPLLAYFIQQPNTAAVPLGRLGLMAFLPLVQMENMSQDEIFGSSYTHEVQWLALVAFSKFLVAARSVMSRHGGKILSALLVARMDGTDERVQLWARHVSFQAYTICGKRGREFLKQIVDSGEYQESFVAVAKEIIEKGSHFDDTGTDNSIQGRDR